MSEQAAMSFAEWLRGQRQRDDPVGDLARDASADPGFPPGDGQVDTCADYLLAQNSAECFIDAVVRACELYELEIAKTRCVRRESAAATDDALAEDLLRGAFERDGQEDA